MELGEFLTKYWQVIMGVGGLFISFTVLKMQNADQEKRLTLMEKKVEAMNPIWSEIQSRLASIETTLQFLTKGMK